MTAQPTQDLGAFAFGDTHWPGLAKLTEECGEIIQVIGKLMMTHGDPAHWSGNLREHFVDELGDLKAAITFVETHCLSIEERETLGSRKYAKIVKFLGWHDDMDADPPPPLNTRATHNQSGADRAE